MKKLFLFSIILLHFQSVFSQTDSLPEYRKNPGIPSFKIDIAPDSTSFSNDQLASGKKIILVVFSPDCGHCQVFVKHLIDSIQLFRNTQLVLASSLDYSHIRKFYEDQKIGEHREIIMGRDANYRLGSFYGVRQYPSAYVYNKKHLFLKKFESQIPIHELASDEK